MNILETLRLALLNLALHKFRSLLAALGIILGVASVELMIAIIEGAKQESLQRYMVLGVDNIFLRSEKPSEAGAGSGGSGGASGRGSGGGQVAEYGLLRKDLAHIRSTFDRVRYAVGVRDMRTSLFSRAGGKLDLQVWATEPDYVHITRSGVSRGRFICYLDAIERKRVCVVGSEAARQLFSYHDPLQEAVRIGTDWFTVVGVLENRASLKAAGGDEINKCVFIPLATAAALYGDISYKRSTGVREIVRVQLDAVALQMDGEDSIDPTEERIKLYLGKAHKQQD